MQARQNPTEKHTEDQDGCSITYRTKDSQEVDLSLKNTSMSCMNSVLIVIFSDYAYSNLRVEIFYLKKKFTLSLSLCLYQKVGSCNETDSDGSIPELEEPNRSLLKTSDPQVRIYYVLMQESHVLF